MTEQITVQKKLKCVECGKKINDSKFCSVSCKNVFFNKYYATRLAMSREEAIDEVKNMDLTDSEREYLIKEIQRVGFVQALMEMVSTNG